MLTKWFHWIYIWTRQSYANHFLLFLLYSFSFYWMRFLMHSFGKWVCEGCVCYWNQLVRWTQVLFLHYCLCAYKNPYSLSVHILHPSPLKTLPSYCSPNLLNNFCVHCLLFRFIDFKMLISHKPLETVKTKVLHLYKKKSSAFIALHRFKFLLMVCVKYLK